MRAQVRVDGRWLSAIAPWGDLSYSTDEHGCAEAAWSAYFLPGVRPPEMHRGALVEVLRGPLVLWAGVLDELDWVSGRFVAKGFSYSAESFLALDGSGNATSTPSVAVDQANVRGWGVSRDASIPTAPFTAVAEGTNTVGALLDSQADELGQRWSVRADRVVRMEADVVAPSLHIRPGVVVLGNASDDYCSAVAVRYLTTGGTYATVIRPDAKAAAKFGYKELPLDLTVLGAMTLARAEGYGDGILAKGAARLGWMSTVEVTADDMTTAFGGRVDLGTVVAGQVARAFLGFDDMVALGGATHLDVVLGSTVYEAGSSVLTIGPVGSVVQTLADAIAALTEEAAA